MISIINRKAQGGKIVYFLVVGLIFTALLFALGFSLTAYADKVASVPPEMKAEFIALRFFNLPECFAYSTEKGRIYPGVIDLNKFTEEQLFRCYHTQTIGGFKTFNFRLRLENAGVEITTDKYYHRDAFTLEHDVIVSKDHQLSKDKLFIHVQEEAS
ncbi:hypothetical protein HYX12_02850 [Candidatus Woesearchaeota archaeon]|nr:hypothetical protein [Candidatus Woesearchaeota archaeon]